VLPDPVPLLQELLRAGGDPTGKTVAELVKARCKAWRVVEGKNFLWVQPSARARLVLSGHLDVVPAGQGWTRDPFGGQLEGDFVWGRGATDMKGAVAAMLSAAEDLRTGDWALALTLDEETGMAGAKALADSGALEGVDLVVIGEPTGMDLGVGHKGVLHVELETQGKAAHGSMPHLGESAIHRMLALLRAVEDFQLPEKHFAHGASTLNLGYVRGGEAPNMVPTHCAASLDLRIPPPGSVHAARKALEVALGKAGQPYQLRVLAQGEPWEAPHGPMVDRVRHALRQAWPEAQEAWLPYGTETSAFREHAPCLIAGPGELALMHAPDERVRVSEVRAAHRFYRSLLKMWS
jgi:succinyl-diaminopimelate desuccinylase